jgi:hypothetical protein
MKYEWKEPEAGQRGVKLVNADIVAILQSRPGQWLFIGRGTRSAWFRSAASHPSGQIELTSRNTKGPEGDIYLRWVA